MSFNTQYFIIKATDPEINTKLLECEKQHKLVFPDNELSAIVNADNTKVLVKVCYDGDSWKTKVNMSAIDSNLLNIIDKKDHESFFKNTYLKDPNWLGDNVSKYEVVK